MTEPKGFRRDIMVLHALSDLMEKHPDLPRPAVEFKPMFDSDLNASVRWYLSENWQGGPQWNHKTEEYDEYQERRKEWKRIELEQRIAAILDAMGPDVEWEKNDPSKDDYYYRLTAVWHGAQVTISTPREAVCEKVIVLETEREEEMPDPAVIEAVTKSAPLVKVMVKDTITEWQCNQVIAEKTAPKHTRTLTVVP